MFHTFVGTTLRGVVGTVELCVLDQWVLAFARVGSFAVVADGIVGAGVREAFILVHANEVEVSIGSRSLLVAWHAFAGVVSYQINTDRILHTSVSVSFAFIDIVTAAVVFFASGLFLESSLTFADSCSRHATREVAAHDLFHFTVVDRNTASILDVELRLLHSTCAPVASVSVRALGVGEVLIARLTSFTFVDIAAFLSSVRMAIFLIARFTITLAGLAISTILIRLRRTCGLSSELFFPLARVDLDASIGGIVIVVVLYADANMSNWVAFHVWFVLAIVLQTATDVGSAFSR